MENSNPVQTLPIPESAAGLRFDQAVAQMFPDYSRSRLTEWIKAGDVLLDGEQVAPRQIVHGGELVSLHARPGQEVPMRPEEIALDIRYEDADLLVINKPAGLVVHPGAVSPRARCRTRCCISTQNWSRFRVPGSCTGSTRTPPA